MDPSDLDAEDFAMFPATEDERFQVFEVMMNTAIAVLRGLIDTCAKEDRDNVARMAIVWPMTCTQAATVAREDNSYAAMIYYERNRLGLLNNAFFFDGMPSRLAVMGAPIKVELPAQQMSALLMEDVIADRTNTLEKLETATPGSSKRHKLVTSLDGLSDVSVDVPIPARLFLSRMRSMCHGLRAGKDSTFFKQCANSRCCRLFFVGTPVALPCMPTRQTESRHASTASSEQYWWTCYQPVIYCGNEEKRFCSRSCSLQWQNDWWDSMPEYSTALNWQPDDSLRERPNRVDARVLTAFDKAVERNAKVAHFIKKRKRRLARHGSALSKADFNREMNARVERLNIDTGLLYAASIYARLPCRRKSLTLPGQRATWRVCAHENQRCAVLRVGQIYRQHPQAEPIHDLLDTPSFLRAIRSQVLHIF